MRFEPEVSHIDWDTKKPEITVESWFDNGTLLVVTIDKETGNSKTVLFDEKTGHEIEFPIL